MLVLVVIFLIGGFFIFKEFNIQETGSDTVDIEMEKEELVNFGTGVIHKMVLGEEGYEPRDIVINLGDTIEFSTTEDKPYWPASNVHPTHRLYSEFDPKEPILPGGTWSFTFDKIGEWRYHDHIAPFYTGTITVIEHTE